MKNNRFYLFIIPLALFFSLFFVSNSFAKDDIVYSFDSSNSRSIYNPTNGESYRYMIIEPSSPFYQSSTFLGFTVSFPSSGNVSSTFYFFFSTSILEINQSVYQIRSNFASGSTYSFTVTFTDNPPSDCPPSPSGTIDISSNGTYDVSSYSTAVVDVPPISGDYHDDLISINNSIIICGAICLVIYFFYCIYRIIIRNSGVK